jgi:aspartyl-tRNA(Asn)/glutamyl-tRNA(Gln) amidotransferase subunit B
MFCGCRNSFGLEKEPNINVCPVCTAQPGSLPVINEEAIKMVIKTGLALNCKIAEDSFFERKNYFYPDLPKGYQISQYQKPLCYEGYLEISLAKTLKQVQGDGPSENLRKIRVHRIHLEEDTGRLIHSKEANCSLIDFNRAGVPLMELVTEPDIQSGEEAKKFCQELQLILRYLGVSDADMENGQMRCEVNISLQQPTTNSQQPTEFGTKVEIKNLNSFRAVEKSIDYEIKRQSELLKKGEKVTQETRGWDSSGGITFSQRVKEEAYDYRYFPEPDLPPLKSLDDHRLLLMAEIPELPQAKRLRLASEYGLSKNDAEFFVQNKEFGEYFEEVCSELTRTEHEARKFNEAELKKLYKLAANYLITEVPRAANKLQASSFKLQDKITPENFAEFAIIVFKEMVSSSGAQILLEEMFKIGVDPTHVIETRNLKQVGDVVTLSSIVDKVIEENPQPSEDYKKGKEASLQFLVGQVMKKTQSRANPQVVAEILRKKLAS